MHLTENEKKSLLEIFDCLSDNDFIYILDQLGIYHKSVIPKSRIELYWIMINCLDRDMDQMRSIQKDLREMPYKDYLDTEYWKDRSSRHKYLNPKCCICGSKENLEVHHNTYEHRGYEWEDDLATLCNDCHAKYHDKLPKENDNGK